MNDITVTFVQETPESIAAGIAEAQAESDALASRTAAREALLDKLGITAEEAQLLLGGM
jgi:hypothetical protein